jgi:lysophospholipase L1-like esterase
MVAGIFSAIHPDLKVKFYNRGIAGDRVQDLKRRWVEDCIELQPNIVSIQIGINDTVIGLYTPIEEFKADYRDILTQLKEKTNAQIILIEPFVFPKVENKAEWRDDLNQRIKVVRELAVEFKTKLIPLDGMMDSISIVNGSDYWSVDGIHPTTAGHGVIAKAYLETLGVLIRK